MPSAYVQKWEHFFEAAIDLCLNDPFKTRVTIKYKNNKSLALIKVTDDKKVFLFKIMEEADLKKIDSLLRVVSQILTNNEEESMQEEVHQTKEAAKKKSKKRG